MTPMVVCHVAGLLDLSLSSRGSPPQLALPSLVICMMPLLHLLRPNLE